MLLDGLGDGDGRGGVVGAVQVPGEEAGEVLEGAESLVAADCGGCSWLVRRLVVKVLFGWFLRAHQSSLRSG